VLAGNSIILPLVIQVMASMVKQQKRRIKTFAAIFAGDRRFT
jgi:ABC-type tungstate transport system substrate-binding protein